MFDIYIDIDNQKPIDAISIVDNTRIPMTKNLIDAIFDVYIDIENQKQNRCDFDVVSFFGLVYFDSDGYRTKNRNQNDIDKRKIKIDMISNIALKIE